MRGPEFRAYCGICKKMLFFSKEELDINMHITTRTMLFSHNRNHLCIPSQYVELQDKKDNKIFVGDIISFDLYVGPMGDIKEFYQGEIVFIKGCCFIRYFFPWKGDEGEIDFLTLFKMPQERREIIGNIWENPNLIKLQLLTF